MHKSRMGDRKRLKKIEYNLFDMCVYGWLKYNRLLDEKKRIDEEIWEIVVDASARVHNTVSNIVFNGLIEQWKKENVLDDILKNWRNFRRIAGMPSG